MGDSPAIQYHIRVERPHRHFIQFSATIPTFGKDELNLCLAAWRPGRYELGNFSKNITQWRVSNKTGKPLQSKKITKDQWVVACNGEQSIELYYEYYAAELNAGSSYLDEGQLYINPVNCFFYLPDFANTKYELTFHLPDNYHIACGLPQATNHLLLANNFDELADSPLIASPTLKKITYHSNSIPFHIWIQGTVNLEESVLISNFKKFTDYHFQLFTDIPCQEYHFLFQFTPMFQRHGVEHRNSTVIAMGPASEFINESSFKDLLGISCHELFHTWNVKSIRPIEMMPYDFSKENYTRLGYVTEGVTTYYGDLILWQCGCISDSDWLDVLTDTIKTHLNNAGRFNHSVADSSFDTWLDGYSQGIPWRKVSIYNEGFLIAWIMDMLIMHNSGGHESLDGVMKKLYDQFGKKHIGFTEEQYRSILDESSNHATEEIFENLIYSTRDYLPYIEKALSLGGLKLHTTPSAKYSESHLGFGAEESQGKTIVTMILPDGPADRAGLWYGDEVVSINQTGFGKNFQSLLRSTGTTIQLGIVRRNEYKLIGLSADNQIYAKKYQVIKDPENADFLLRWKNRITKQN